MNFQNHSFISNSSEYLTYIENTSPPSTGGSSAGSYSAFQYPPFHPNDTNIPNSLTGTATVSSLPYSNTEEWTSEYSPQNEHFQALPLWNNDCDSELNFDDQIEADQPKDNKKKKPPRTSTYKHVPHREKPVHLVARRNARERKRVQAVNHAFVKLRKVVPVENRNKRLSKVKTLQCAIQYINELERILADDDGKDDVTSTTTSMSGESPTQFDISANNYVYR